ncbi:MAG: MATE family efflux transporter [Ruminococcaceae bacterium]|nr:MATE family efflux transporter [Oscillospiraceae bacterium]MBE7004986.1 MATE family efflux transporter [Oscillospiraceae bacterium]
MGNESLLRDTPVWTAIRRLVIPSVLTILIMVIYNIADMFFIAMLGNDTQVAAVAVVGPVFSLATAAATTIGAGGCTLIARALGAENRERAQALSSLCAWAALCFGLLFTVLLQLLCNPVLLLLGATEELMGYAENYLRILSIGTPLMLFSVSMASVIRAEGIIVPGMISNLAGTMTNLLLDPLLILGFRMGVTGAALATVLGNLTSSVLLVLIVKRKCAVICFTPRLAWKNITLLLPALAAGLPNGVSSVLSGLASTFSNRLLNPYGAGAIAAMAAAGRAVLVITMVQMGICMGVSPLLSYAYGAKNLNRLRETIQKTALLSFGFGLIAAAGCYCFRNELLGLFLKERENLAIGNKMLTWLVASGPFLGFYYLGSNYLQATGRSFRATFASVLRQGLLLIPLLYLLHGWIGLTGIAAAHTVADISAIVISALLCVHAGRRIQVELFYTDM